MKNRFLLITAATILSALWAGTSLCAKGFTDAYVHFYGEVRQVGGAQTVLLQAGTLEMTFVNQSNPANRVTLETELQPTGKGDIKPYSYALKVPLSYLPEAARMEDFLSIRAAQTDFKLEEITIDGVPATLPDGSKEFYGLSFASRATDYRLDLLIVGDSTDTDEDGLPDWWEELYGLNPDIADSGNDFDDDGWSNLEEFNHGSDPTLSNREPQLATTQIYVPESGLAGVYLHVLDSDSVADAIALTLTGSSAESFQLLIDGVALGAGVAQQLTLSELQQGRVTVAHLSREVTSFPLPVSWSDGGDLISGVVLVQVMAPSSQDGNDATLWLDGFDLIEDGQAISTWADRSGNGLNAVQPLADHQPMASNFSVDFSQAASSHLFFQDVALPSGNHTVLAAYHTAASSDSTQTIFSTNRGFLELAPTTQAISYPGAAHYQMDGRAVRGYENTLGVNATSIFRRSGDLLENVFGLAYDGRSVTAGSIDPLLPIIGGRRSAIPTGDDPVDQSFGGQLHELLIFPSALPEQKLRDVHDYLESKWSDAVVWDFSTEFKALILAAPLAENRQIIRGGHGDDVIGGGAGDDILSGGPGADTLTGAAGVDRFVFGGLDTGSDRITDFELEQDVIDLSALFWGQTGDARPFISVRLDANFSNPIPTLDTVLIVQLPTGGTQEIVLENTVVGSTQLIQLIGEGHIRMGGLSIPSQVELALPAGASTAAVSELMSEPFEIVVTRSGDGVAAALDVPLGFFKDALGGDFIVEGASSNQKRRSVVSFARGELTKTLTVRPIPNLDTTGSKTVEVGVLPNFKYAVSGESVERTVTDNSMVWLDVVQSSAVSELGQAASVLVHRDGDLSESLQVDLELRGTAKEGVHIQAVPRRLTLAAGQSSAALEVYALADGLTPGAKVVHLQLVSAEDYQLGNPREAILYAATSQSIANEAGFDRWLQTSTQGSMQSLGDMAEMSPQVRNQYMKAYAFGLDTVGDLGKQTVGFKIVDGRPEIKAKGAHKAADIRWGVESTSTLGNWGDASDDFSEAADAEGLKLMGAPIEGAPRSQFFRLSMQLDPGVLSSRSIDALTGASRSGISGTATWDTDQETGDLVSSGSSAGDTSRIIAEVVGARAIDFEMEVIDGGAGDLLSFYIDGVLQVQTAGAAVRLQHDLEGAKTHLLMWEFKRGEGNAVIRNLAP